MEARLRRKVRVGDLLLEKQLIDQKQLQMALVEQKRTGKKLGKAITDLGFVSEVKLLSILSDYFGYPFIDLSRFRLDTALIQQLPETQARRYRCLLLSEEQTGIMVGMADPTDLMVIDDLQRILKRPVLPAFVQEDDLLSILDNVYRRQEQMASIAGELAGELQSSDFDINAIVSASDTSEAPVVRLLQSLFEDAVQVKASDVHIEPEENQLRIRLRVDGELQEQVMKEKRVASALVSRLKIMSGLDISEKRLPQDGRFNIRVRNKNIDVRLSTMPVQFGESVVMRLLDQSGGILSMSALGMREQIRKRFEYLIARPHGLILVTGPTGSGKTTTLYAALTQLNQAEKKIITAEDPIEYRLPRINQVQVNTKVGLEFSTVLRAALRQDPDIVLIGEMRDHETAEIGLRAAMTGHMVLSTLHTNDAQSAAARLMDMGVDSYLVASSLRAVLAQRLIKKLCPHCTQNYEPDEQEKAWLETMEPGSASRQYLRGRGCHHCNNTGYQGRVGIYELLELDSNMIGALRKGDSQGFAEAAAKSQYFRPLAMSALDYAAEGLTSLDEVFRVSATLDGEEI
ncbi:MAG: MSHA biogenesis protein MshE [Thalassolituus sp.]|jgi:MSHA biogenesis protein MshE|nr:ATPase, T2SS/T4P/T4SS family [Pseudomonadota bacterium]MEC8104369.1 ATPase, T2SS/T4P/T4SS family [Pseudomonadota bacterium]MEE2749244.1 ATPase, T2SS/T4P/T4SS family [Pseudomonadota bacterium]TNC86723.1 MAG: MSHA biogenesis protein MshE [Thalassolituus sp.]